MSSRKWFSYWYVLIFNNFDFKVRYMYRKIISFFREVIFRAYFWLYWNKRLVINFIPGTETQTWLQLSRKNFGYYLLLDISKQNNMHTTPPQTHIAFIMAHPKGIGICYTCDNRCFNFKDIHSKSNELSSLVKPVPPLLNDSVINPPHLSSVFQQSSRSS